MRISESTTIPYVPPRQDASLSDAVTKASGLIVSGLFFRLWDAAIAWPLLTQGAGILATRLVLNLNSSYALAPAHEVESVQAAAHDLLKTYPYVRVITFLFSIALSWVWLSGSMALGFGLGAFGALTADFEPEKKVSGPGPLAALMGSDEEKIK